MKEKRTNNIKLTIIIIIVGVLLIGFGSISLIFDNSNKNNSQNNSNNNNEEQEVYIEDIEIDENIKKIYNKYHSDLKTTVLSGGTVESEIYNLELIDLTHFANNISNTYATKILEMAVEELNKTPITGEINTEEVNKTVSEMYKKFFGSKAIIDEEIALPLGCTNLIYEENQFQIYSGCGTDAPYKAEYSLESAKKGEKHLYLYENVTISDEEDEILAKYKYKWTYDLNDDNNYYLSQVERVADEHINMDISIDKMQAELKKWANDEGSSIYSVKCTDLNEEEGPRAEYEYTEISKDAINKIIQVLQKNNKIEEANYGFMGCTPKNITIIVGVKDSPENYKFKLAYTELDNVLLVVYKNKAYSFFFENAGILDKYIENIQ